MADGRKRRNAGKALPSTTTMVNSMKQKTLFDSFPLKNSAKIATRQHSEEPDLTQSGTTVKSAIHGSSIFNTIDLTKARTKSPSPFIEYKTAHEEKGNTNGVHTVSSIIVVDDDDASVPATTGSPKPIDTSQSSVATEGKSADQPIIILASPVQAPSTLITYPRGADKPSHPFFSSKPKTFTQPKASSPKHVVKAAPYPGRSSQHVKGFQTPLQTSSPLIFPCREQRASEQSLEDSASYAFLKRKDTRDYLPASLPSSFPKVQSRPPELNNIPDKHGLSHPAMTHFMNKTPENLQSRIRPWSEKWRPSCAQEVLGNEVSATYLRDWLRALELQLGDGMVTNPPEAKDAVPKGTAKASNRGTKRPRVVRAVEKTRGRKKLRYDSDDDEEDDWIVHTDEESGDDFSTQPEVDDMIPPPSLECSQNSDIQPLTNFGQDLGQLHNTILLTGPHGIGKTAAVYACAEELDWDVFEVYPGIGKRNGASLENYIGEVGKNHLVRQTRSLFRQREDLDVAGDEAGTHDQNAKSGKSIRQSLILLEEVDILFKEDNNFWNTVTGIIKECKRPVVCTCNDVSLVPVHDLPLQAILEFKPCSTDAAVSYLQNLCSAEGYFVESDNLLQLYTRTAPSEGLQSAPDLRRTIHALQVICLKETKSNEVPPGAAKTSLGGIEFLSYMDSYLMEDASAIEELASYIPSNDDEIGYRILYDPDTKDTVLTQWQQEISAFAREISCVDVTREGYKGRECELRRVVEEVCPMWAWCRQDGCVYMDYAPLIRQIVEAEDAQEEAEMKGRGGRGTRNSTRAHGYVRTVILTAEGRGLIRESYVM